MARPAPSFSDHVVNILTRGILASMRVVPYRWRIPAVGWIMSRIAAPLVGWNKRVRDNLAFVLPDLPNDEVRSLMRTVPDNAGRMFAEAYSGDQFIDRVRDLPLEGTGVETLNRARDAGRPVILLSGHFGNYEVARAAISRRDFPPIGGLYKPLANQPFNDYYVRMLSRVSSPIYPTDREGLVGLHRHIRGGGWLGVLIDIHASKGAKLTFFGKLAPTAVSAMEWALKYDAVAIPVFAIRQNDGLSFRLIVEEPIPHTDPETMGQAYNDLLERYVRAHMDQWFWIHRRWRQERYSTRAAASTGPKSSS